MKGKFVSILSLLVLLSSMIYVRLNGVEVKSSDGIDPSKIYGVQMLWNNSMAVNDVAVSKDGNYIVAVNNTGVFYFAWDNSTPKWWYWSYGACLSVAISADGEYVVAGHISGCLYYFNDSRATIGERADPTWTSIGLGGSVERGTLDMSGDGDYVVVGGTGVGLYYFAGCRARSGSDQTPTWQRIFGISDFLTVHISSDGKYVAAGGRNYTSNGFVMFYKDANDAGADPPPDWLSWSSISSQIIDLALSDDGYSVVAIDEGPIPSTLYYWANATNLTGDPDATWTNSGVFNCVDMSADGDNVVAGGDSPQTVHFWSNTRKQEGTQEADWVRYQAPQNADDVVISDDGGIIAASTESAAPNYKAYFLKSDGTMINEFDLVQHSPLASMSENGLITAVAGPGFDSLYVFKTITDTTPPLIKDVYQVPANDNVYPTDDVMVFANVTDDLSGVKQVILNYTYTNGTGTWHGTVVMDPLELDIYNGTIPKLPFCTNVTYVIIAEDNCNNTATADELELRYHVIPEFSPQIVLPLLVTATLLTMLIRKRKLIHQAKT